MPQFKHIPAPADGGPSISESLLGHISVILELNSGVQDELALADLVSRGLPHRSIASLLTHGIPESNIFASVIPKRTYNRRRATDANLSVEESDKAERVARLLALATIVFDDEDIAAKWLAVPQRQFDDRSPLDLIASSVGTKVVQEKLLQSYFGFTA